MSRVESQKADSAPSEPADSVVRKAPIDILRSQVVLGALEFTVAFALAGVISLAIWIHLPRELHVRTDIVGFPIHSNFNPYVYYWRYWLLAGLIPIATLGIFLALSKLVPHGDAWRGPRALQVASEAAPAQPSHPQAVATAIGRTLFVGAIFALETAAVTFRDSSWILPVGVTVTAAYALLAALLAAAATRIGGAPRRFWECLALVNIVAVPLCFVGLYVVSRSTKVTVEATGHVHEYSWLPAWLAIGGGAALLAWALSGVSRAAGIASVFAFERRLVLVVAAPVALLLLLAALPGVWAPFDMFHEGEPLAGERLIADGAFPWRDLIFIHGLLADVAFPWLGLTQFEDTRWGFVAGTLVILTPLYWVSVYYLCAYLFHRNWLFLVATQVAVVLGVITESHLRFIFLPLALLLLAALLSKPSTIRAAAFTAVVIVQAIVTPEAGLAAFPLFGTVLLFELYYYDRSRRFLQNMRRTVTCACAGVALSVILIGFLAAFGALDDFAYANLTFSSHHELTGALPVHWVNDRFIFEAIAPVALVALGTLYVGIQVLRGRPLSVADWTMGGLALFVGIYYHKFLARADTLHARQAFAVAVPLLFYALYRLISVVGTRVHRLRPGLGLATRSGLSALVLLALVIEAPNSLANVVSDAPTGLDVNVPAEPKVSGVGFITPEKAYVDLIPHVDTIVDAYTGPKEAVFDFTNSPALFYYLLRRPSATRYYHVSMAIRAPTQDDLVKELARARPKLVIFSSTSTGLPAWDGITNQVRHYRVSRYLLDHYRPLALWSGLVFMGLDGVRFPSTASVARRLGGPLETSDLYSRTQTCDWGYVPNFFAESPSKAAIARPVSILAHRLALLQGWAIDSRARKPAAEIVAAIGAKIIARGKPSVARPDIARRLRSEKYRDFGYVLQGTPIPLSSGESLGRVRVYGLSRSGQATELTYGPGAPREAIRGAGPRSLVLGSRRIPVVNAAAEGFVDSVSFPDHLVALDLPGSIRPAHYGWLELETSSPLHENSFAATDLLADVDHWIYFKTLARGETRVRVYVGACSQWHGYSSRRLYLRADRSEAIKAVRLYR